MAGNQTEIGEGMRINGTVESDEDLVVRGHVEGTIRVTTELDVQVGGIVVAEVEARNCVVSGSVAGNVAASDSVRIVEGGRMVGDIRAPRVILQAGGASRGNVDMGDIDSGSSKRTREKGPAASKKGSESKSKT